MDATFAACKAARRHWWQLRIILCQNAFRGDWLLHVPGRLGFSLHCETRAQQSFPCLQVVVQDIFNATSSASLTVEVKAKARGAICSPAFALSETDFLLFLRCPAVIESLHTVQVGVGIDLGTTYSCIGQSTTDAAGKAAWNPMLAEEDKYCMPSVVCFSKRRGVLVGQEALDSPDCSGQYLVRESKRLMGLPRNSSAVADQKELVQYEIDNTSRSGEVDSALIVGLEKDGYVFQGKEQKFLPEEIAAFILMKLKKVCESSLRLPCRNAVVTVPAQFSDGQRKATRDAGNLGCKSSCSHHVSIAELSLSSGGLPAGTFFASCPSPQQRLSALASFTALTPKRITTSWLQTWVVEPMIAH